VDHILNTVCGENVEIWDVDACTTVLQMLLLWPFKLKSRDDIHMMAYSKEE